MNLKIIVISLTAGIVLFTGYMASFKYLKPSPEAVFCTQDAMQCPDGSYVGRTGPNCEFAVCPNIGTSNVQKFDVSGWQTYRNEEYGFEMKDPSGWFASNEIYAPDSNSIFGITFQSADFKNNFHGIGLPGPGNMWVNIFHGACNEPTQDFIAQLAPDILEKTICQNGFQATLGLWQKDSDLDSHKNILNQILSTFKFLK